MTVPFARPSVVREGQQGHALDEFVPRVNER